MKKDVIGIKGYQFEFVEKLEPISKKYNISKEKLKKYNGKELVKSLKEDINIDIEKPENIDFCKFKIYAENINKAGVYLWVIRNEIVYIGEASNLRKRFNYGYGNISPRNIFKGGQSTNCKMNRVAMKYFNEGANIEVYFYETPNYKAIEQELLEYNKKENKWNLYNTQI